MFNTIFSLVVAIPAVLLCIYVFALPFLLFEASPFWVQEWVFESRPAVFRIAALREEMKKRIGLDPDKSLSTASFSGYLEDMSNTELLVNYSTAVGKEAREAEALEKIHQI